MFRTLIKRCSFVQLTPSLNIHLSTPKLAKVTSQNAQSSGSSSSPSDDVKFEYINKTGVILLNKPKALNALSLPMIEQIYPKLKVVVFVFLRNFSFKISVFSNGRPMVKLN